MHQLAPTLETASITATVSAYVVDRPTWRRRYETHHLHLWVPGHGELDLNPLYVRPALPPDPGDPIELAGRRTWVGTYLDTPVWPAESH